MQSSVSTMSGDVFHLGFKDHGQQLVTEHHPKESSVIDASRFVFYLVISNVTIMTKLLHILIQKLILLVNDNIKFLLMNSFL